MTTATLVLVLAALNQAPASLAPRVEYFLVENRILGPDGKPLDGMAGLARREYRPSEGTILETGLAIDPDAGALPTVLVIDWTVTGTTGTFKDRAGRMTGTGKFIGPAWKWTEWSWTATMRDVPGTFRNTAKATRHGVMIHTERIDATGKRLEAFDERQTRITKETYDLLRSKLLPQ